MFETSKYKRKAYRGGIKVKETSISSMIEVVSNVRALPDPIGLPHWIGAILIMHQCDDKGVL